MAGGGHIIIYYNPHSTWNAQYLSSLSSSLQLCRDRAQRIGMFVCACERRQRNCIPVFRTTDLLKARQIWGVQIAVRLLLFNTQIKDSLPVHPIKRVGYLGTLSGHTILIILIIKCSTGKWVFTLSCYHTQQLDDEQNNNSYHTSYSTPFYWL